MAQPPKLKTLNRGLWTLDFGLWAFIRPSVLPLVTSLVVAVGMAPNVRGATPAVLVNSRLESERVMLLGLSGNRVVYFDHQRVRRDKDASNFIRIRSIGESGRPQNPGGGLITLTDGQRLTGRLIGSASDGQAVVWRHPTLGRTKIRLTRIAGMIPTTTGKPKEKPKDEEQDKPADHPQARGQGLSWNTITGKVPAQDILQLTNGDTLRGFVQALTDEHLRLTPEASDKSIQLPLGRVASMRLANPRQSLQAKPKANAGRLVVLTDGTRVLARSVILDQSTVQLTDPRLDWTQRSKTPGGSIASLSTHQPGDGDSFTVPLRQVVRIDLPGSGLVLDDLTSMSWQVTSGGKVFGVSMAPIQDQSDLLIHAPITLQFHLHKDAQRLTAKVVLDPPKDVPTQRLAWADCTLKVHHGTDQPAVYHFSADHRRARINLPIRDSTLKLELAPAANGPILDRLRLTHAAILRRIKPQ